MASSQRQSVITLLDKNKNRLLLKNWRPISLLNTDYKVLSKAIANRLVQVLPSIIHSNQSGYVKGRRIQDNIRTIHDIMELTKQKNIQGIMACIDFEKAFDSAEWDYLIKTLETFNFGSSFITWIKTFYTGVEACVMNSGKTSRYFKLERGVRQGDPISAYLFILALEPFARAVDSSKKIKGIKKNNTELKALYFADDTTGILADQASLKNFLLLLNEFEKVAGLKVNLEKTEAKWLGPLRNSKKKPCGISWPEEPIRLLGIYLSYNTEQMMEANYSSKLKEIKHTLNLWKQRKLTISGKIILIKSLIHSKLYFVTSVISIPERIIDQVQNCVKDFLWGGKKAKVRHEVLCASYENGGQNMADLRCMINAQRLALIKRYFESSHHIWKECVDVLLEKHGGGNILFRSNYDVKYLEPDIPLFYKETLTAWSVIPKVHSNLIWNNQNVKINGKSVFFDNFFKCGIWYMNDLFETGKAIPFEVWKARGLTDRDYLRWRAITQQSSQLKSIFTVETANVIYIGKQYQR